MDEEEAGDDGAGLLPIGVFARLVGVTASALRFYDDSGLLRPAFVDPVSGYRWYAPGQQPRAVLLRRLRAAGVPLADTVAVLDGTPAVARRVLSGYLEAAEARWVVTRRTVGELLAALPDTDPAPGPGPTVPDPAAPAGAARVQAGKLRAALTQVAPAVGVDDSDPALRCVLVEVDTGEVRLVSTDRYRLAVRVLKATDTHGSASALVDPGSLAELTGWIDTAGTVQLEVAGGGIGLTTDRGRRVLPAAAGAYPDYRQILSGLPAPRTRGTVSRSDLLDALHRAAGVVVLTLGGDRLTVTSTVTSPGGSTVTSSGDTTGDSGVTALPASVCGPGIQVVFALEVLLPAVTASVGPDVLFEVAAPDRAVVVRSADEGAFTTLVMPTRLPAEPTATGR